MIRHIVAFDVHRGIAKDGVQPWKLPSDEQYFADMTKKHGGVILMGRTTYEVIGRPLPNRQNFVASRNAEFAIPGITAVHDVEAFLQNQADVWVIGGAQLYAATLLLADELYITEIEADFACDTFYPALLDHFQLADEGPVQYENDLAFRYNRYIPRG